MKTKEQCLGQKMCNEVWVCINEAHKKLLSIQEVCSHINYCF